MRVDGWMRGGDVGDGEVNVKGRGGGGWRGRGRGGDEGVCTRERRRSRIESVCGVSGVLSSSRRFVLC